MLGIETVTLHDWIIIGDPEWDDWVNRNWTDSGRISGLVTYWAGLIVHSVTALRSYTVGNQLLESQKTLLFGSAFDIARDPITAGHVRDVIVHVANDDMEHAGAIVGTLIGGVFINGLIPLKDFLRCLILLAALTLQQHWGWPIVRLQERIALLRQLLLQMRTQLLAADLCMEDLDKVFTILSSVDDRAVTQTPGDEVIGGKEE